MTKNSFFIPSLPNPNFLEDYQTNELAPSYIAKLYCKCKNEELLNLNALMRHSGNCTYDELLKSGEIYCQSCGNTEYIRLPYGNYHHNFTNILVYENDDKVSVSVMVSSYFVDVRTLAIRFIDNKFRITHNAKTGNTYFLKGKRIFNINNWSLPENHQRLLSSFFSECEQSEQWKHFLNTCLKKRGIHYMELKEFANPYNKRYMYARFFLFLKFPQLQNVKELPLTYVPPKVRKDLKNITTKRELYKYLFGTNNQEIFDYIFDDIRKREEERKKTKHLQGFYEPDNLNYSKAWTTLHVLSRAIKNPVNLLKMLKVRKPYTRYPDKMETDFPFGEHAEEGITSFDDYPLFYEIPVEEPPTEYLDIPPIFEESTTDGDMEVQGGFPPINDYPVNQEFEIPVEEPPIKEDETEYLDIPPIFEESTMSNNMDVPLIDVSEADFAVQEPVIEANQIEMEPIVPIQQIGEVNNLPVFNYAGQENPNPFEAMRGHYTEEQLKTIEVIQDDGALLSFSDSYYQEETLFYREGFEDPTSDIYENIEALQYFVNLFGETTFVNRFVKELTQYQDNKEHRLFYCNNNIFKILVDIYRMYDDIIKENSLYKARWNKRTFKRIHDILAKDYIRYCGEKQTVIEYKKQERQLEGALVEEGYEIKLAPHTRYLVDIGASMNLCVGGYGTAAVRRRLTIAVLYKDKKPHVCIEIQKKRIVQSKLHSNQTPNEEEATLIALWAAEHGFEWKKTNDLMNVNTNLLKQYQKGAALA